MDKLEWPEAVAIINAALDEVLGEPIGEVIGNDWKALQFLPSVKRSKVNGLPAGTKLYAPRREK